MAFSGTVKFILEDDKSAIVEETKAGASSPEAIRYLVGDAITSFSSKVVGDTISYVYANSYDITLPSNYIQIAF